MFHSVEKAVAAPRQLAAIAADGRAAFFNGGKITSIGGAPARCVPSPAGLAG